MENNAQKTFIFLFALGVKVVWSGDKIAALLERASPNEREGLRNWMERCKPGWHYELDRGTAVCSGYDENAQPIECFEDEGHGITSKSKDAFLNYRRAIGPVEEIKVSWNEGVIDAETIVIGQNGNRLHLSGFGIGVGNGGGGEEFTGLIWLLDMCGVKYDMEVIRTMNVDEVKNVSFQKMYQTSNGINLTKWPGKVAYWSATVVVSRQDGEKTTINFPPSLDSEDDLFYDIGELIDIVIAEMEIRGVKWTADPRLFNLTDEISKKESARIGWNFTTKT